MGQQLLAERFMSRLQEHTNAKELMESQPPSSLFKTYFGHGVSAISRFSVSKETAGGVFWLWRRVYDKSIFEMEGIWYSTRLVASNFAQLLVCLFILVFWISTIHDFTTTSGPHEVARKVAERFRELLKESGMNTDPPTLKEPFESWMIIGANRNHCTKDGK